MSATKGEVVNAAIGEEKTQRDYYNKANHYDTLWGQDNIHLGYYPHLIKPGSKRLNFQEAGSMMTSRMCEVANINANSVVLDLGCGKGIACKEICELTGASCVGMDLSETNVQRCNELAKENPKLKLEFCVGSFTELPKVLTGRKYTHVFAQLAFCHVHELLPQTMEEVKKVLGDGGLVVIMDYLGTEDPVIEDTREHVHKRLHFSMLHGHLSWRRIVDEAGFNILHYENLDRHMLQSYTDLADEASKYDFRSADGEPIVNNYRKTVEVCAKGQIGMNLAVLSMSHRASL